VNVRESSSAQYPVGLDGALPGATDQDDVLVEVACDVGAVLSQ
jgi:hypothetical protein